MPGDMPLRLKQGRTFHEIWEVDLEDESGNIIGPRDLTGLEAKASGYLEIDDAEPAWEVSTTPTSSGHIVLGDGTFEIKIVDEVTRELPVKTGKWDSILIQGGDVEDFLDGPMPVERGLTQP